MSETPLRPVETDETPEPQDVKIKINVDWKRVAKSTAKYLGVAIAGAAVYALLTNDSQDEDASDDSAAEPVLPELPEQE